MLKSCIYDVAVTNDTSLTAQETLQQGEKTVNNKNNMNVTGNQDYFLVFVLAELDFQSRVRPSRSETVLFIITEVDLLTFVVISFFVCLSVL